MNKRYVISFLGILLFSIGLYNYQDETNLDAEIFCDEQNRFCVSCPNAKIGLFPQFNAGYTYVSYSNQFKILVSKQGNHFSRINCKQFLKFVARPDFRIQSEELNSYFSNKLIEAKNSQVEGPSMDSYSLKIFDYSDFVVFYKNQGYKSPSLKVLNQANLEKLLKFQRSISWSMLFTLLLKTLDYKIGLFTTRASYQFPWMEIIILFFGIVLGNDSHIFFTYYHIGEMMFLAYVVHKFLPHINEKLTACLFFMICIGSYFSPLGYILTFASFYKYKASTKQLLSRIIILSIVTAFFLNLFQTNWTIYASYLWKIIMYPLIFLQFQLRDQQWIADSIFHQTNDMK